MTEWQQEKRGGVFLYTFIFEIKYIIVYFCKVIKQS
jgi:hypothetical protein